MKTPSGYAAVAIDRLRHVVSNVEYTDRPHVIEIQTDDAKAILRAIDGAMRHEAMLSWRLVELENNLREKIPLAYRCPNCGGWTESQNWCGKCVAKHKSLNLDPMINPDWERVGEMVRAGKMPGAECVTNEHGQIVWRPIK